MTDESSLTATQDGVVAEAYDLVADDTKFIRLTTITTIIHSMIFLLYIMYSVYFVVQERTSGSLPIGDIFEYVSQIFNIPNIIPIFIVIALILAIGYSLLPPIGEAAMIFYLDNPERRGTLSLGKGLSKFFPMFEYGGLMAFFSPLTFFIFASRFRVLGLLDNIFVIIILSLRMLIIFFVSVFFPYAKFIIVLENASPFDAMKKSMHLALENIRQSIKFASINYILYIRAIMNILIFLGVPSLIIYGATQLDISSQGSLQYVIYGTLIALGLLTAYINGIVEGFFMTVWYKLYKKIS